MSIWYDIKDKEDLDFSLDGKDLHINFGVDQNGSHYVSISLEMIKEKIKEKEIKCECGKDKHPEASICKECIEDAFNL